MPAVVAAHAVVAVPAGLVGWAAWVARLEASVARVVPGATVGPTVGSKARVARLEASVARVVLGAMVGPTVGTAAREVGAAKTAEGAEAEDTEAHLQVGAAAVEQAEDRTMTPFLAAKAMIDSLEAVEML